MQNNLERFFNEVQEGQDLGHHNTKWYMIGSHIIALFGKVGNKGVARKSHTSIVAGVQRSKNKVSIDIIDSTATRGVKIVSNVYQVEKSKDGKYKLITARKEKLYWHPYKITEEQLQKFQAFKVATQGKKYAKLSHLRKTYLIRFYNKFAKFIKWFFGVEIENIDFKIQELKDIQGFYCSQHSQRKDYEIGKITRQKFQSNPYPDPMTFFKGKEVLQLQ